MPSLYEIVMGNLNCDGKKFTIEDWRALGKGEIENATMIQDMLAEGYEFANEGE